MKEKSRLIVFGFLLAASCGAALLFFWLNWPRWMEKKTWPTSLPLSGGKFFDEKLVVPAVHYSQRDPRWGADKLAATTASLAEEGCAVAAAAMALASKGSELNPGELNAALVDFPSGFTPQGWIYWEAAAAVAATGRVKYVYEGPADFLRMDAELQRGNPVIVRLRLPNGQMHFVVVVGKDGFEYLVNDPADVSGSEPRPLSSVGGEITGMRFYLEVPPFFNRQFLVKVPSS
jgi:hypothetical protein